MSCLLSSLKIDPSWHLNATKWTHLHRVTSWHSLHGFGLLLHLESSHHHLIHEFLVVRTNLPHVWILLVTALFILLFLNLSRLYLVKLSLRHLTSLDSLLVLLHLFLRKLRLLVRPLLSFFIFGQLGLLIWITLLS